MSTLAEQVVEQLKTDMDNVYDAGYQKGKSEGGEDCLKYASFVRFDYDSLPPKVVLNLDSAISLDSMFANVPSLEEVTINSKAEIKSIYRMFYQIYYRKLRKINIGFDTSKIENFSQSFAYIETKENGVGVVEINGVLDISNATSVVEMFAGSSGLKEVRFKPSCIKLSLGFANSLFLSDESIQSIIDGLADLTGQATQTLTFHADVKNELSEEQRAIITSKNWTLA